MDSSSPSHSAMFLPALRGISSLSSSHPSSFFLAVGLCSYLLCFPHFCSHNWANSSPPHVLYYMALLSYCLLWSWHASLQECPSLWSPRRPSSIVCSSLETFLWQKTLSWEYLLHGVASTFFGLSSMQGSKLALCSGKTLGKKIPKFRFWLYCSLAVCL